MKLFTGLFVNKYEFENALVLKFKHFDMVDLAMCPLKWAPQGGLA